MKYACLTQLSTLVYTYRIMHETVCMNCAETGLRLACFRCYIFSRECMFLSAYVIQTHCTHTHRNYVWRHSSDYCQLSIRPPSHSSHPHSSTPPLFSEPPCCVDCVSLAPPTCPQAPPSLWHCLLPDTTLWRRTKTWLTSMEKY